MKTQVAMNENIRDLKIDMMGFIFIGLVFAMVITTYQTLEVLGSTRSNVILILNR